MVSNAPARSRSSSSGPGVCSVTGQGMPQVTTIIDSHVVGIRKPDARIFLLALDALDVPADRSVYT
ncbi:MAG: hypothetical protein WAL16_15555, partial [Streptosporangiaceae bacterium]